MIAVQTIKTTWTKAARGGEGAALRSCIPKALPLDIPEQFPSLIWHSVHFSEVNSFKAPCLNDIRTSALNEQFGCANIEIKLGNNSAILTYRYQAGAPARIFYSKSGDYIACEHSIAIDSGHWAAVEYNGRFACIDTGNWWYEHVVVNVAVAEIVTANFFLISSPLERYLQLAHLA